MSRRSGLSRRWCTPFSNQSSVIRCLRSVCKRLLGDAIRRNQMATVASRLRIPRQLSHPTTATSANLRRWNLVTRTGRQHHKCRTSVLDRNRPPSPLRENYHSRRNSNNSNCLNCRPATMARQRRRQMRLWVHPAAILVLPRLSCRTRSQEHHQTFSCTPAIRLRFQTISGKTTNQINYSLLRLTASSPSKVPIKTWLILL